MLKNYLFDKGTPMELIGGLIPKGKTTLLHGRSGGGKTWSILKFFMTYSEDVMFVDFDWNYEIPEDDKITHIDGYKLIANGYENIPISIFSDEIVVIDTYAMATSALGGESELHSFIDKLNDNGATVVVIAHTAYFSGKPKEPLCDAVFANHVACRLHLENEVKKTKTNISLEIEKLRGVGSMLIENWMRETGE